MSLVVRNQVYDQVLVRVFCDVVADVGAFLAPVVFYQSNPPPPLSGKTCAGDAQMI